MSLDLSKTAAQLYDAAPSLTAQRTARLIGQFIRLWRRDGKPGYLDHYPRLWRRLDASLAHPALAPVAAWFEAEIPCDKRRGLQ